MRNIKRMLLGALCAAGLLAGASAGHAATVVLSAVQYNTNVTWYATNEYQLNGYNYVLSNATLTIEAGTVIKGAPGSAPNFGALFICRHGKINAVGTRTAPIIFTSQSDDVTDAFDLTLTSGNRGLWGGVVLLGNGIINEIDTANTGVTNANGSLSQVYEGMSGSAIGIDGHPLNFYGGNDNNDSSGVMKYVSMRYGGKALESNKEINGLSMGAVGRGTTIEFCEAYMNSDDGFEWWGGAVNSRYLSVYGVEDDMFDMDLGHVGKHQFWFGLQAGGAFAGDKGMELNGQVNGLTIQDVQPYGKTQIYNATLIGEGGAAGGSDAIVTRDEPYHEIYNSVFTEFQGRDNAFSGGVNRSVVQNNHFFANATAGGVNPSGNVLSSAGSNPLLLGIDRGQNAALDPRPASTSPVYSGWRTAPVNGHFEQAAFKGAFDQELWISSWTALADNAHLAVKNVYEAVKGSLPATKPEVVVDSSDNVTLTWTAWPGLHYQVQVSTNLTSVTNWVNVGTIQTNSFGTNIVQSYADSISGVGTKKHFRVITGKYSK